MTDLLRENWADCYKLVQLFIFVWGIQATFYAIACGRNPRLREER